MGIPRLERHDDGTDILSYQEAIGLLREGTRRQVRRTTARRDRAYTIPLPEKEFEPYATGEMLQRGDFREEGKDPYGYVLASLNLH